MATVVVLLALCIVMALNPQQYRHVDGSPFDNCGILAFCWMSFFCCCCWLYFQLFALAMFHWAYNCAACLHFYVLLLCEFVFCLSNFQLFFVTFNLYVIPLWCDGTRWWLALIVNYEFFFVDFKNVNFKMTTLEIESTEKKLTPFHTYAQNCCVSTTEI